MRSPARAMAAVMLLLLGATANNACSAGSRPSGATGSGGGATAASGGGSDSVGTLSGGQGGGPEFDAGQGTGSGGFSADAGCTGVSSTAMSQIQPADIILAVDTSGSMKQEKEWVKQNLPTFASLIANSGIDVHVIFIASADECVPAPLGTGACPGDEKLPGYRHVPQSVDSNNVLDLFISTYPQWKSSLRPEASKTFAVVSDDNSDLSAANFTSQILALDPPTFQGFKLDAIISFVDPVACSAACAASFCTNCGKCCPLCIPISAAEGKVYKELVQQTGGVIGDLCDQNFGPVFTDMATAVVQGKKLSCTYPIPPVPNGGTIDPTKVNVAYTPGGGGMPQQILNVPGGAPDCGPMGGWYYDNPQNPMSVIMCPATCMALQADPNGKVDVVFGCSTIEVPPK
jgi:hypothetical protein